MELDFLKKTIQDYFQENTLTIVGSGLSVAEGIPGMSALADELKFRLPSYLAEPQDKNIWEKIDTDLSTGIGLEKALHNTKPSLHIEECIRKTTARLVGEAEAKVLLRLVRNQRALRFTDYMRHFNIRGNGMVVVTTNYDRLIEYACEYMNLRVDTLYVGRFLAHFQPEQSKYSFCQSIRKNGGKSSAVFAPKVTVLKPHGCLSWHMIEGNPYSIPSYPLEDCLIITPGINKYKEGYSVPFDIHRTRANSEIDSAQRYIIIGYGFGDDHLETHLIQQLNAGKPALILTYSLSETAKMLVKKCSHITAIVSDGVDGSKVMTATEEQVFPDINLWDLKTMLEEVF
ncbi:SIR2 family protein [Oscillospiraceae bacterium 42-9]